MKAAKPLSRIALSLICAMLAFSPIGPAARGEDTVPAEAEPVYAYEIPAVIADALSIAKSERAALKGGSLSRSNKYTKWYCRKPCEFGWCGGFVSYCLDVAGVPMDYVGDTVAHPNEAVYSVREASVGKLLKGFTKMERLSAEPRPGYLVIYAVRKSSNKTVHVGMITRVDVLEDGRYLLSTIEGNMSSRIKEYRYIYDPQPEKAERNMFTLPEAEWTDDTYQYTLHTDNWYVNTFCATWVELAQPQN